MQLLNDWLRELRAEGLVLLRTRVAGAWGVAVPERPAAMFHFVAEGQAVLRRAGADPLPLRAGELVLLAQGGAHDLVATPRARAMALPRFLTLHDGQADGAATASTLLCGEFAVDRALALPALQALPAAVVLRADGPSPLADTLRLLRQEVEAAGFGSPLVVRSLLALLFVYLMRQWASEHGDGGSANWFGALRSPAIARALACMHGRPEHGWTLDALAREAGQSRAAFVRHFTRSVGEPPLAYLTRWRIGLAARLLESTDLRMAELAWRAGYGSEPAFSRAFRRARGVAPAHYRAQHRSAAPA
ncbi:AraC family transcriptional regulator [Pseudorhodoferax sp.]|uniref:AraC family transcriptional regulator n=1 Tax=Pseudorhodoferax sp. TaxID=1993553 RepID=UPI002DD67C43|nr:AraC family transcriptional regulator [Pseudorhodoferax sp.]